MKSRYVDYISTDCPKSQPPCQGLTQDSRLKGSLVPRPSLHTTHSPHVPFQASRRRRPMPACCPLGHPILLPPETPVDPYSRASDDKGTYWWPWRDRRALMGWLAGCGAPCWLATQLNRLIPKYICVLHWNFVLPHCPAQARLPGANLHPPPRSSGACPILLCRLPDWKQLKRTRGRLGWS